MKIHLPSIIAAALLLGLAGCATSPRFWPHPRDELQSVSLVRVLANPREFHNVELVLHGYLVIGEESSMLFLNELDSRHGQRVNAVGVDLPEEVLRRKADFSQKYVGIRGVFDAAQRGVVGDAGGWIKTVKCIGTSGEEKMVTWPESKVGDSDDPFAVE